MDLASYRSLHLGNVGWGRLMSDLADPLADDLPDAPWGSRRAVLAGAAVVGTAASLRASRAAAQGSAARGPRKPIVLVGGLACTPDLWTDQVAGLADVAEVIVTEENSRHPTMRGIARAILKRAPPEFALAGLSMGGYIAFEIMRLAPRRVTHLALLDTSARPDTDAARNNRGVLMDLARDEAMRAVLVRLMPNAIHPDRLGDKPMVARLDYAASEPNEADDMLGRPRAAHQLRPPEQHPAPHTVRGAGQGGGGARRHHLGARQAIRPVLLMEKDVDLIRVLSGRVLLIQRGRIVRELPAAGPDDPALEHESIG